MNDFIQPKQRYNHEYMKPHKATFLIGVLLLSACAFGTDKREVSPEEATKHLQKKVGPVYPSEPSVRVRGDVVLQVEIGESGVVDTIQVISGHPMLMQAAIDAVQKWRYSPFLVNGKPVAVKRTVRISFSPPSKRAEAIQKN